MKRITYLLACLFMLCTSTFAATEVEDFSYDWTAQAEYGLWAPDDIKPYLSVDAEGLKAVNETAKGGNWEYQFHIADNLPVVAGKDYVLKITVKGSADGYAFFGVGNWGAESVDCGFNFTNEWKEYSVPFSAIQDNGFVVCQMGKFVGTIQIKSVKICHYEGAFSGGYMNFDLGTTPAANLWEKKLSYTLPKALELGADYTLTMDVKSTANLEKGIEFWPIWAASSNKTDWGTSKDVQYVGPQNLSSEWVSLEWKFTSNFTLDQLDWVFGSAVGNLCIDNIRLVKDGTEENLVVNGDFAQRTTKGWVKTGGNILSIVEGNSPSTDINQTLIEEKSQESAYYTLQGMKTDKPTKGVFIHKGKKVVVK